MKRFSVVAFFATVALMACTSAYAGVWDTIKGYAGSNAIPLILTGLLAIGAVSFYTDILSKLCIAAGALLTSFGVAVLDRKLTKDEIADMKSKLNDLRDTIAEIKKAKR